MPGMHGHHLAQKLQASQPGLSVLFVSGYTEHPVVADSPSGAGVSFLQKPVVPAALTERVRQMIRSARVKVR